MNDKHLFGSVRVIRPFKLPSDEYSMAQYSRYLHGHKYPASSVTHLFSFENSLNHINLKFSQYRPGYSAMSDEELIVQTLLKELSQTRFACSDLTKLNGGTANYLYRGKLLQPLDSQAGAANSATETVVVKHSEGFSPGNRDFLLDIERCVMIKPILLVMEDGF